MTSSVTLRELSIPWPVQGLEWNWPLDYSRAAQGHWVFRARQDFILRTGSTINQDKVMTSCLPWH